MENSKKPVSFHQTERNRLTPLKPLRHSNSLHRTSAGPKSRPSGDEKPIINDFYLSDLSTSKRLVTQKPHIFGGGHHLFTQEDFQTPCPPRSQKISECLPCTLREFFSSKKDFQVLCDNFDKINYCLETISEKVKCYRAELGNLLEKTQSGFMNLFERMLKSTMSLITEAEERGKCQVKILLEQISGLQNEKTDLNVKNQNLRSLYNFQESEYRICKMNSDSLQNELVLLHELLKKDIMSLISHVRVIEDVNRHGMATTDLSDKLKDLNDLIWNLESEQDNKKTVINSMNNLLKAMLKGNKNDMATQVNEVELLWRADMVITSDQRKMVKSLTYQDIEASCVNIEKVEISSKDLTNLEMLKLKEKQIVNDFEEKDKLNIWNLSATLMVFLENALKNNECGRVLPWIHYRKMIYAVYNERVALQNEIKGCFFHNSMPLDEFLCVYFMKIHKVRRIAEIKLLEFLISLKYYAKIWPRALLFANLCNIIPYTQPTQEAFLNNYDMFAQEYFFFCFQRIHGDKSALYEMNEGQTLLSKEKLEDVAKDLVFFYSEVDKRKFVSRMSRIYKKAEISEEESFEGADIDKMLEFAMTEYFETKKRNFNTLSKKFSKISESENGLISYEEFKGILNELGEMVSPVKKLGFSNEIVKLRAYIYSITSGKNKNDIVHKEFNSAVLKYGLDSPFPLISLLKQTYSFDRNEEKKAKTADLFSENYFKLDKLPTKADDSLLDKSPDGKANISQEKKISGFNLSSAENTAYFGQHFTILRELKSYCKQFKEAIEKETNTLTLLKHFDNIANIIDLACQFLAFPIKI